MYRYPILALSVLLTWSTVANAQDPRDAVEVDPTHHHVILENDYVRVFEVLAAPGATSVMHTHPPLVAVSQSRARLNMRGPDGAPFVFDLHPGQVLWMEDVQHAWELLSGEVRIIAVEPKAADAAETRPIQWGPRDAVAVDPDHHHVILDNEHVRVFEVVASPGATSELHSHARTVAISLDKARIQMAGPDGEPFIFDLNPGQVLWLEDIEHSWELLAGQVHVIAVEPKAAPDVAAAEELP